MNNSIMPATWHNSEAERALIGSALVNQDAYTIAAGMGVKPESFYLRHHGAAWKAIGELIGSGLGVDVLSVSERAHFDGLDLPHLIGVIADCPTSANADSYAAIVVADCARRRIVEIASESVQASITGEPGKVASEAARQLDDVAAGSITARVATAEDAANEFYDELYDYVVNKNIPGIPWGFKQLDFILGGRRRKELLVIAGRPGMGKSSLAGTLSYKDAKAGLRVSVCTLEMNKGAWMEQAILAELAIRKPKAGRDELARVAELAASAQSLPMRFYERGYCKPEELELNISLHARELGGLDVVYIDHLGYIDHGAGRVGNVAFAVGVTTKRLARIAKEYNCSVVLLCQLNRASEAQNREPSLIDLRDSGEIEQDARLVIFLHRPDYRDLERSADENCQAEKCKLIIAKNNSGPTGVAEVAYTRAYRRFSEYDYHSKPTNGTSPRPQGTSVKIGSPIAGAARRAHPGD